MLRKIAVAEDLQHVKKCLQLLVQSAANQLKYRSNQAVIVLFIAVTVSQNKDNFY